MPQIFILQHHTLLCIPLQHVSLYDILQQYSLQYYPMILIILLEIFILRRRML